MANPPGERRGEIIGYTCAYTPLALIDAAGFSPYRLLPLSDAPDQAGTWLHDNLCPQVKRLLDRALADDLPDLSGVVMMTSCDAMRRLADAWRAARPSDRLIEVELPTQADDLSLAFLAKELSRLQDILSLWAGRRATPDDLMGSLALQTDLARSLDRLQIKVARGTLPGGSRALQEAVNRLVTHPLEQGLADLHRLEGEPLCAPRPGAPIYLFGNVLPSPEAFGLLEEWGCRLLAADLCTASRQFFPLEAQEPLVSLARGLLSRPPCARTMASPGWLARDVADRVRQSGARGALAHVVKFCDPYLTRMPAIREELRAAGIPLLVLEGDCTLRSLGQHRTRVEAFVEMLEI